ncbi:MAG: hypothetical protein QOJ19_822 [Acidimicrobiia bacterium]|nr:hypothetical protein [Acidimicrobiia bacterium]
MSKFREREIKLAVEDGRPMPSPQDLTGLSDIRVDDDRTVTLTAAYWDTTDLRLLRRGHTLRHRTASDGSEDTWTLKLAAPVHAGDGSSADRDELSVPGEHMQPPAALSRLVLAYTRHEPLVPVATVVTERRILRLEQGDALILEVADDRVTSTVDGEPGPSFRELEVELRDPQRAEVLDSVVERLKDIGAGSPDGVPKLKRVLERRLGDGEEDVEQRELGRASTIVDVARAALASGTERLLRHDPDVRFGNDVESLHQARVATRRLRSDLRTLGPVLRADRIEGLRSELAWLGGLLGAVRDADVLADRLRARGKDLPEADRGGLAGLVEHVARQREDAQRVLVDVLGSGRYLDLVEDLVNASKHPPLADGVDADRPARQLAEEVACQAWRRLAKWVRRLDQNPPDADLHEARKRAKRARYAMELLHPMLGGHTKALASRLADLQDALGELQDAVVAEQWLRDHLERLSPHEAFVAGRLSSAEAVARTRARHGWKKNWRSAKKRSPA